MRFSTGLAIAALLLGGSSSRAAFISGDVANSESGLGNYTGSLTVTNQTATTATLTVSLTNTSPTAGYLTAFALNNPNNAITGVTLASNPANFGLLGLDNNDINGAPFGQFDFGASTSNSFVGGGPPQDGLAVGASGTFVFNLTGTNLNTLTDLSFVNTLSSGSGAGQGYQFFAVRFRGFPNGGSDKVPGLLVTSAVPEPSSMALVGIAGIIGLGVGRARKRRNRG